jgi:mRNA interferase MazF
MADGEIKVESALRVDKIYTISQSIVVKKLGKLKPEKIVEVKNKFKEFF